MLHWLYVGLFDPRDPTDRSEKPYKPKVIRPISKESVERVMEAVGRDVEEFICYAPEGYVVCNWSAAPHKLWRRVHQFADRLAQAGGAVIMSERFMVESPPEARLPQDATWVNRHA